MTEEKTNLPRMQKQGKLPCMFVGVKCLVNLDKLIDQLNNLGGEQL